MFKGDSKELLRKNLEERTTAYCGLENLILDGRICQFQMSPFWQTYVGIKDGQGDTGKGSMDNPACSPGPSCTPFNAGRLTSRFLSGCTLKSSVAFSFPMLLSGISGVALFYAAPWLVASMFFRLSCGSILFTTGSLIILIFVLMRWDLPPSCILDSLPSGGALVPWGSLWVAVRKAAAVLLQGRPAQAQGRYCPGRHGEHGPGSPAVADGALAAQLGAAVPEPALPGLRGGVGAPGCSPDVLF